MGSAARGTLAAMATLQDNPKLALLAIPGSSVWLLLGLGVYWENDWMIGGGIAVLAATLITGFTVNGLASSRKKAELRRIWTEGTPATARIVSIEKRGAFNGHPNVVFQLEVATEDGETFECEVTQLISELAVPRIQPEMAIDVRIDPEDRAKIVLDAALTPYGYD